jgi:hypothetical protein
MPRTLPALLLIALAGPALAETEPNVFMDDRSSPESVVISFYNAIHRHEYLRAWSYYDPDDAPDYPGFRDGYAGTDSVKLRVGEVQSEGAAGSIQSSVPVALRATATDGTETIYTGCYRLTQVQPANQDMPPFRPIQIDAGEMVVSDQPFASAMGVCAE